MAGDWIKVRTALPTHPKIVRMASALCADRFRTLGGILSVWCLFDAHSEDGHLDGYTSEALDSAVGFPGISGAMCAVGWLKIQESGLFLPSFETHNGTSAKRRAQEADRKADARKLSAETSASDADKKRTREEKRREEQNPPVSPKGERFELPDWVPKESWQAFEEMRVKIRKPLTNRGRALAVAALKEACNGKHRPQDIIDKAVLHSWQSFYRPDESSSGSESSQFAGVI
ncbi:MAG: hypothetical protein KGH75_05845 [Rhodospirillales bacterium]|nr:hypothetical protein [Rhodospirillales bacterium]